MRVSWDVALIWRLKSLKKSLKKTSITPVMVAGGMRVLHRCHHLAWRFFNTTLGGLLALMGNMAMVRLQE